MTNQKNELRNRKLAFEAIAFFEQGHFLFGELSHERDVLDEAWEIRKGNLIPAGSYDMLAFRSFFRSDRSRTISVRTGIGAGEFYGGHAYGSQFELRARPSPHFTGELEMEFNAVRLPSGDFNASVLSTRLTYNFNTDLFAKVFAQWSQDARTVSTNFLVNYIYRPGSDFYLVYDQLWDIIGGHLATRSWNVLMKVTYWLDL